MRYSAYFKPQQKILLKTVTRDEQLQRFEAVSAFLVTSGRDYFDLAIACGLDGGGPLFQPGTNLVLISEAFGLGIELSGEFVGVVGNDVIRVRPSDDLEAFSRREYPRVDATAGVHCLRGKWSLGPCRGRWEAAVRAIEKDGGSSARPHLVPLPVNLSAGGIRLHLKGPVESAELCLVLIDPGDRKPPVCALCEVAWTENADQHGMQSTGLRFVNILKADRDRLDLFVREALKQQGFDVEDSRARQELLDRMRF